MSVQFANHGVGLGQMKDVDGGIADWLTRAGGPTVGDAWVRMRRGGEGDEHPIWTTNRSVGYCVDKLTAMQLCTDSAPTCNAGKGTRHLLSAIVQYDVYIQ